MKVLLPIIAVLGLGLGARALLAEPAPECGGNPEFVQSLRTELSLRHGRLVQEYENEARELGGRSKAVYRNVVFRKAPKVLAKFAEKWIQRTVAGAVAHGTSAGDLPALVGCLRDQSELIRAEIIEDHRRQIPHVQRLEAQMADFFVCVEEQLSPEPSPTRVKRLVGGDVAALRPDIPSDVTDGAPVPSVGDEPADLTDSLDGLFDGGAAGRLAPPGPCDASAAHRAMLRCLPDHLEKHACNGLIDRGHSASIHCEGSNIAT